MLEPSTTNCELAFRIVKLSDELYSDYTVTDLYLDTSIGAIMVDT